MKTKVILPVIILMNILIVPVRSQDPGAEKLPHLWNELTAPEFLKAVELSEGICLLPAGIIEKHGPHLPLSTDLILSREISSRAAEQEYALVFPEFYFGQIHEARHQPGTLAYSPELVWNILEETCDEMARNGIRKIIIVNGHGGNNYLFSYFCQAQLAKEKDYTVVFFRPDDSEVDEQVEKLRNTDYGGHADEVETSEVYTLRPELVDLEMAASQSGKDLARLAIPYGYAGIGWYASYPNHYAGDGSVPNKEIGELSLQIQSKQLAELIRFLKNNDTITGLQQEFHQKAAAPVKTKQ